MVLPREDDPLWVDWDVPDDPFAVFMDSYYSVSVILFEEGPLRGDLFHRMVFVQLVGALEAYLGDTLVKTVLSDPAAMARLMRDDRDLSAARFPLVAVAADPDFVRETVKAHLKGVLYHNLAKVDALYRIALDVPVLGEASENDFLFKSVKLRHDCVHRNGYTTDGVKLQDFTKDGVWECAEALCAVVKRIELAVRGRQVETNGTPA